MTQGWIAQFDLTFAKLVVLGVIHASLFWVVSYLGRSEPRALLNRFLGGKIAQLGFANRLALACIIGLLIAAMSLLTAQAAGPATFIFLQAGLLSLWYIEAAILLAYGFFKRLFDSELPFEITLFVSFVVMMNAGYFTFMFILSILRAPKLI